MIKLARPNNPPAVLSANSAIWKSNLLLAVKQYGSYKDIPNNIKESLLRHYRQEDIKIELLSTSYNKCAFCESPLVGGITIEVEHFAPKSLYPEKAFDWLNLLPACRKCNGTKGDHDTVAEPIINPYEEDPEKYLFYDCAIIVSKDDSDDFNKSERTISVLRLNDDRLIRPRSEIYRELSILLSSMKQAISELGELRQGAAIRRKALDIANSIDIIEGLAAKESKYSSFVKHYLSNSPTYQSAKVLVLQLLEAS